MADNGIQKWGVLVYAEFDYFLNFGVIDSIFEIKQQV